MCTTEFEGRCKGEKREKEKKGKMGKSRAQKVSPRWKKSFM